MVTQSWNPITITVFGRGSMRKREEREMKQKTTT